MQDPNRLRQIDNRPVLDRAYGFVCTGAFILLLGSVAEAVYLYMR